MLRIAKSLKRDSRDLLIPIFALAPAKEIQQRRVVRDRADFEHGSANAMGAADVPQTN